VSDIEDELVDMEEKISEDDGVEAIEKQVVSKPSQELKLRSR